MNQIFLQSEHPGQMTCVSNCFIDEYMPSANGEYVKVYLYLLRSLNNPQTPCDLSRMADLFEYSDRDLTRALVYWERMGLLELTYNESKQLCGITLLEIPKGRHQPDPDQTKKPESSQRIVPADTSLQTENPAASVKKEYTKDELQRFSDREDVSELLFIAERYLQKPLSHTELNYFLYWYDSLHFSIDLIEYLVEYCVTRDTKSVRYMDKVALAWSEAGITTVEEAKKRANLYSQVNYAVVKALGIKGRNLVELETSMIRKWTTEYGFSLEIIIEACNRTISATHQPSFEYTDRILTNWHKAGVKELTDIDSLDQDFRKTRKAKTTSAGTNGPSNKAAANNTFNKFPQRTYDYEQLEQQLLNRSQN